MRYLNWDVLLFPGTSRVPIQEFNTKCHVLTDLNNRLTDSTALDCNPRLAETEPVSQVPVLTSFISSLEHGSPFRVSVHSWDTPSASQILQTFKTPGETVAFEARIYTDGNVIAHRLLDNSTIWPEVIESTGNADTIRSKPIQFPVFHPEILDQAHWEPGESYGRVRVVIAEGVKRNTIDGQSRPTFDRLRDVITFSFQHAPKRVLEYSGIAWPNARLFRQGSRLLRNRSASRDPLLPDFESHAHSPQRQGHRAKSTLFEPSSAMRVNGETSGRILAFDDPFVGPTPISLRGNQIRARNTSNEAPKYFNSTRTTRSHAGTDMSGVSYQQPDFERAMNEAAIEEIVQALSPERRSDLLQALSPGEHNEKHTLDAYLDNYRTLAKKSFDRSESDRTGSPSPILPRTINNQQSRASVSSNLLASRFSSAPVASRSATLYDRGSLHFVRKSMRPILPVDLPESTHISGDDFVMRPQSATDAEPRSSSIASKRKRTESSGIDAPEEIFRVPSMSIFPSKVDVSSAVGVTDSPACDAFSLDKPEV